jgi:hypothetical protein
MPFMDDEKTDPETDKGALLKSRVTFKMQYSTTPYKHRKVFTTKSYPISNRAELRHPLATSTYPSSIPPPTSTSYFRGFVRSQAGTTLLPRTQD